MSKQTNSEEIITISNDGDEQAAPLVGSEARIAMPAEGLGLNISKLAGKILVAGQGELAPPDRKDRQLKSLVAPKTVFGQDDRIRVKKTVDHPWRMICQLETVWKNGKRSGGTGWMAGPLTVITAGHCVYDKKMGWAKSVHVVPGRNDEEGVPFGSLTSTSFGATKPWIQNQSPEFDIASIHLPGPFEKQIGHFAFAALADEHLDKSLVNITGYPFDKGNLQLWHDRNKLLKLDPRRLWYQADTERGQSGAPVYTFPGGLEQPPVVVGVHVQGSNEFEGKNSATRITPALAGAIRQWTLQSASQAGVETDAAVTAAAKGERSTTSASDVPRATRVIYIPGEGTLPSASELKQGWDEALFGHSIGDLSHLFHFAQEIPDLDVPVRPDEATMESVASALEADVAPGAADLAKAIGEAILKTGENQLLYGLEQSISWLTLITRYFLGSSKEGSYRERVANDFLKNIIEADPELGDTLIVTHGFGAVVAYDLLTTFRDKFPDRFRPISVVTLASPLAYEPIKNRFDSFEYPQGKKGDDVPRRWLDVAVREDPIACDVNMFPSEKAYEFLTPKDVTARAGLEEFYAELYLSLPRTRSFIKSQLPTGFGAPVTKFLFARDVADRLSDTAKRMDVLIELNSRIRRSAALEEENETMSTLEQRATNVVNTIRGVKSAGVKNEDLALDIMHRYVAAKLLPSELREFVIEIEKQAKTEEHEEDEDLVVHHVWRNAEMRCLTHRSNRVIQVGAARSAYRAFGGRIHWAVLDSGVDEMHPHFQSRDNIVEVLDFTSPNFEARGTAFRCLKNGPGRAGSDHFGHGTHVAGIIGGENNGHRAIAPRSKLHCYKVIDDEGGGRESSVIRALEHIYEVNANSHELVIHGVNLSIGCSFDPAVYACGHSPVCKEIRRLWEQGVVVCIAAGNAGLVDFDPDSRGHLTLNLALSIGDPANVEESIAVGSVHATHPHSYGVSYFSSRGPTADGRVKPDCVAPGERIRSAAAGGSGYRDDSGTSMASPHVSGLIAAFLSVRREFIGRPDEVKQILLDNCTDIKRDRYHQGAGVPNLMKMLSNT